MTVAVSPATMPAAPEATPSVSERWTNFTVSQFYAAAFGLREKPFSLLPDPDFLFWSAGHQAAFAMMEYGLLSSAPITLITGDVGTGKTTLLHHLLRNMEPGFTVGLISNARGGRRDLLRWALHAFDLPYSANDDHISMANRLNGYLMAEHAAGRPVLLIIDEAQNLSVEAIETLRTLVNLTCNNRQVVQVMLIGQTELHSMIFDAQMKSFMQRVASHYRLEPLLPEATAAYISHRMRHAGGTGREFSAEALALIHSVSGGLPRTINKLCEMSLVYAATEGRRHVTAATVRNVVAEGLVFLGRPATLH